MRSLSEFYALMRRTRDVRADMVRDRLDAREPDPGRLGLLRRTAELLRESTVEGMRAEVELERGAGIQLDLTYEITELEKDVIFFSEGEEALLEHLRSAHPGFADEVTAGLDFLGTSRFDNFVSDRDGTVNNYCGRYLSSIQSAYNAVFLTRFARRCLSHAVVLTSAPLDHGGLVDISTTPRGAFVYAGSKGREYIDTRGTRGSFPVAAGQQEKLDRLNDRIEELLNRPAYRKFSLIGSGFQKKFGQSTIARQDISESVRPEESEAFLKKVEALVAEVDPGRTTFRIEDTGKDIEVILTVDAEGGAGVRDFSKGDGVVFLNDRLGLGMERASNLVCGDTHSDVFMLDAVEGQAERTKSVFVTEDPALRESVTERCRQAFFVSCPDVLVVMIRELAGRN